MKQYKAIGLLTTIYKNTETAELAKSMGVVIEFNGEYCNLIFSSYDLLVSWFEGQKYFDYDEDIKEGRIVEIKSEYCGTCFETTNYNKSDVKWADLGETHEEEMPIIKCSHCNELLEVLPWNK